MWSSAFKPTETLNINLTLNSRAGGRDDSSMKGFYLRLDPRRYVGGTIVNYTGTAESTVESFMGIVEVLSQTKSVPIVLKPVPKGVDNNPSALYSFNWWCRQAIMTVQTYNIETPTQEVTGCNITDTPAVLIQRNSLINKILATNNATEISLFFVKNQSQGHSQSQNFVVKRDILFYIRNSGSNYIVLCIESYSKLNETEKPGPICMDIGVTVSDY